MTMQRKAEHAVFTVERVYGAKPERVFAAWSNPEAKAKWFAKSEVFEFRVGGREFNSDTFPDGTTVQFEANYQEIVQDERIVYSYSLDMNGNRVSVSVASVELKPENEGTRLVFTESGVFLDGHDTAEQREHGTGIMMDMLGKLLSE
ncbi:polyketide cyclase [Paenibacillus lycopersici]|uniref:Polyketide cyclase n=1 Tax=Paenibacillus lycopersici TaxID=2704462 RepID=A0A6C0G1D8_9BACL|nr:SRPBCC family protein [Paenibacillus lycopersici]QHT62192.1 polyketide cyclase [Paenibacillus lycopersici]